MIETEFILTFETGPQIIYSLPILPFSSKKEMIAFCKGMAMTTQTTKLIKVSMCVTLPMNESGIELPEWYKNCNGKLWKEDLK